MRYTADEKRIWANMFAVTSIEFHKKEPGTRGDVAALAAAEADLTIDALRRMKLWGKFEAHPGTERDIEIGKCP